MGIHGLEGTRLEGGHVRGMGRMGLCWGWTGRDGAERFRGRRGWDSERTAVKGKERGTRLPASAQMVEPRSAGSEGRH